MGCVLIFNNQIKKGGIPLTKKKSVGKIIDTPARQRLFKEIGKGKMNELEKVITEEVQAEAVILETPARKRLRKAIGEEDLSRIEAKILRGEL